MTLVSDSLSNPQIRSISVSVEIFTFGSRISISNSWNSLLASCSFPLGVEIS